MQLVSGDISVSGGMAAISIISVKCVNMHVASAAKCLALAAKPGNIAGVAHHQRIRK